MKKVIVKSIHTLMLTILFMASFMTSVAPITKKVSAEDNSTLKVDLQIMNLSGNGSINHDTDFWVTSPIPAAADIAVSGTGSEIIEPWVVLTVPKLDGKITKPSFVDSAEAYETLKTEDANYYYVTYKFRRIGGGFRATYPFPFSFKESPTRHLDKLPINLKIVDGSSKEDVKPILYSQDKIYTALKQEYMTNVAVAEVYEHPHPVALDDTFDDTKTKLVANTYTRNVNTTTGQITTGQNPIALDFMTGLNLRVPAGTTGKLSLKPHEYAVIKYDLPEKVTPTIPKNASDENGIKRWTSGTTKTYEWNEVTRQFIIKTTAKEINGAWHVYTNPNISRTLEKLRFTDIPFNEVVNIPVTITQKYVDEPEKTYRTLTLPVKFVPVYFNQTGNVSVFKDNLNGNVDIDGRKIWYNEGTYQYIKPKDKLYAGNSDVTSLHMIQHGKIANSNNGSSFTDKTNGRVSDIYKIIDKIDVNRNGDKAMYYETFKFHFNSDAINNQINTKENILYGIKEDGTRVEIARNIKTSDTISLNDKTRQYTGLEVEFPSPIRLDNATLNYIVGLNLMDTEWQKFEDGTYINRQVYRGTTAIDHITGVSPVVDASQAQRANDHWNGGYSSISLWKVTPTMRADYFRVNKPTLVFDAKGTLVTYQQQFGVNKATFGPLEKVENIKSITLLPPGFVYKNTSYTWTNMVDYNKNLPEPEVIENYKGTGRTAVIYSVPDFDIQKAGDKLEIHLQLEATKYATQGNNTIQTYYTWKDNDFILPGNAKYIDELDLDNDGDRQEAFMTGKAVVNYIPPLELLVSKQVGFSPNSMSLSTTGDLGYSFFYGIKLFNNTIAEVKKVHVLDVLPYVNDHTITPNQEGVYQPRLSEFVTTLSRPLEDLAVNQVALERFDVFYQLTPQGNSLESVRDGEWLTKDEVTDFSKVKSIKLLLKEGSILNSKEEVTLYVESKIPMLKDTPDIMHAYNSAAASTDGILFTEANKVAVTFAKYRVDGVIFKDYNKDGIKQEHEDTVSGKKVALIDKATGKIAVDVNGNEITTTTNDKGIYHFDVYKRGDYKVAFYKNIQEEFTPQQFDNNLKASNLADISDREVGYSFEFALNPTRDSATLNAGLVSMKRDIVVEKVSAMANENGSKPVLAGAVFKLVTQDGIEVATKTTDNNGKLVFSDVPFGDYTIVEISAPLGYAIDEAVGRKIVVNDGELSKQIFENTPITRTIQVKKVDTKNNVLSGAVFELYKVEGTQETLVKTSDPTNAQGFTVFENVPYGHYSVKEKIAPTGYTLSTLAKPVSILENAQTPLDVLVANEKIKATITLTKVDANQSETKLMGVVFALLKDGKEVMTAVTDVNGIAKFENVEYGDYIVKEKSTLINYNVSTLQKEVSVKNNTLIDLGQITNEKIKGSITLTKVDADHATKLKGVVFSLLKNGVEVATSTTDDNGIAKFENVEYGDYKVKEKSTLENYNLNSEEKSVNIRENGKVVDLGIVTNTKIKGTIKLTKTDFDDNSIKLAGVEYALLQNGVELMVATTDHNGVVTFENVEYGDYTIKEKTTLQNYNLSHEEESVSIRENGKIVDLGSVTNEKIKGAIKLTKVDADNHAVKLAGVEFVLLKDGKEVQSVTTNVEGIAKFEHVEYGTYVVKEKTALVNYNLNSEEKLVEIRENNVELDLGIVTNTKIKGTITLTKVDADNVTTVLKGVEFALLKDNQEIATAKTNDNGVVTFENIEYGDYTLREKTTLENYNLSSDEKVISIREDGKVINLGTITNAKIKGTIFVTKKDTDTNEALARVDFVLTKNGKETITATSDENGIAKFENVEYGDYQLTEKTAKIGYLLSDRVENISIRQNNQRIIIDNWLNTIKKGKVIITKQDADTKEALSGVVFALRQGDKEIAVATTNEQGVATFDEVRYGDYTLIEKSAKVGYVTSNRVEAFAITEEKQTVSYVWTNSKIKGSVKLTKVDADNHTVKLSGVEFALLKNGKELTTAKTDLNGVVMFENIEYGNYTIKEKNTLENYYLNSEEKSIVIREHDKLIDLGIVTNTQIKGFIKVTKVDADNRSIKLKGVTFVLKQGDKEVAQAITNEQGEALFTNIVYGQYTLAEKATLLGYQLSNETRLVTVKKQGEVIDLGEFVNHRIPVIDETTSSQTVETQTSVTTLQPPKTNKQLPNTGTQINNLNVWGLLSMLLAGLLIKKRYAKH